MFCSSHIRDQKERVSCAQCSNTGFSQCASQFWSLQVVSQIAISICKPPIITMNFGPNQYIHPMVHCRGCTCLLIEKMQHLIKASLEIFWYILGGVKSWPGNINSFFKYIFFRNLQACWSQLLSSNFPTASCPTLSCESFECFGTDTFFKATPGTVVKISGYWWFLITAKDRLISLCFTSKLDNVGNWNRLMPAPWNDPTAVILEGLWSKLSNSPTVNRLS